MSQEGASEAELNAVQEMAERIRRDRAALEPLVGELTSRLTARLDGDAPGGVEDDDTAELVTDLQGRVESLNGQLDDLRVTLGSAELWPAATGLSASTVQRLEEVLGQLPLAAQVTVISKLEANVKQAESELLNYYLSQIQPADFPFEALKALLRSANLSGTGLTLDGS